MLSLDTVQGIYDDTFDTGYHCDSCEYKYVVDEPHGEVTRHCSQANYPEECPIVENAIDNNREEPAWLVVAKAGRLEKKQKRDELFYKQ
jgi:hypothetical protein